MRFFRRHWYSVGLVVGAVALGWAFLGNLTTIQFILLLNFVVLMVHQFEEYGWPGGFPWIMNEVIGPKSSRPDRYLLNQNSVFFINVPLAWPFYFLPVLFPNMIWLGVSVVVLFGLGQLIFHGIVSNLKLKTFYNPGLAAVVLGHLPLGIWYLVEVYSKGPISVRDWVFAVVMVACFIGIGMVAIGFNLMADKHSEYPFAPEEMERWNRRGHLARIAKGGMNAAGVDI